jgi:hypothetical protein
VTPDSYSPYSVSRQRSHRQNTMSADRPENGVCFHVCVHVCVCVCVVSVSAQSKAAQDLRVCMSVYGCLFVVQTMKICVCVHECVWVSVYVHKRGRSAGPLRVSVCCTNYEEVQDRCVCLFMCTNNGEAQDCCVFVHVYMPACNIPTCHAQKVQAANFVCVEHTHK